MVQREQVIEHLRRVRVFADCSDDELVAIDEVIDEVEYQAGDRLTQQGDPAGLWVVVAEGHASVEKDGEEIAALLEGSFVGELSLLDNTPQNATVVAVTDVRAFVLTGDAFRRVLDNSSTLREKVQRAAADRRG
jgi:cAMP-dependent protein kinase regulator